MVNGNATGLDYFTTNELANRPQQHHGWTLALKRLKAFERYILRVHTRTSLPPEEDAERRTIARSDPMAFVSIPKATGL